MLKSSGATNHSMVALPSHLYAHIISYHKKNVAGTPTSSETLSTPIDALSIIALKGIQIRFLQCIWSQVANPKSLTFELSGASATGLQRAQIMPE